MFAFVIFDLHFETVSAVDYALAWDICPGVGPLHCQETAGFGRPRKGSAELKQEMEFDE